MKIKAYKDEQFIITNRVLIDLTLKEAKALKVYLIQIKVPDPIIENLNDALAHELGCVSESE